MLQKEEKPQTTNILELIIKYGLIAKAWEDLAKKCKTPA